ncbi:MAG: HEAT repeat domain-containing protein [Deltaproteobacteria bacterium]|nr:HEAT repeat domain-containing protein [Deltaproteobacteria bacterium]
MSKTRQATTAVNIGVLAAALALSIVGFASRANAQSGGELGDHPAVNRYNRVAKGANVEEWKRRLGDADVPTRLEAVESLGTKGGEEAVRPLIEATADSDLRVRIKAIDYLGTLRARDATGVLMQLLFLNDVGREEKLRSLTALSRIADPATSERLLSYARTVGDEELVGHAIFALGEIGDPATRAGVLELEKGGSNPDLARLASDAVEKIDARAAAKPVQQPTLLELEKKLAARPPKK